MSLRQRHKERKQAAQQRKDDQYWEDFKKESDALKQLQATYYEACGILPCSIEQYAQWLSLYLNGGGGDSVRFVSLIDWSQFGAITKSPSFNLPPLHEERARFLFVPAGIEVNAMQREPCGARAVAIYEDWGHSTAFGLFEDGSVYISGAADVICSPEVITHLDLTTKGWVNLENRLQENWKSELQAYYDKLSDVPYEIPYADRNDSAALNASIAAWREFADEVPLFMRDLDMRTGQCREAIDVTRP